MAITNTTNFGLTKDSEDEFYDVDRVNANSDIIDSEIKKAQDRADEAFQSANNGKETIKNAIIGVDDEVVIPTDATFAQLATAISQIETGVDTTDATALASQILAGMTAYINKLKVIGNMSPKLSNLIKNGSFENGDNCWETGSVIVTGHAKTGTYSLELTGTTDTPEMYKTSPNVHYIQGHKYYISLWVTCDINSRGAVLFPATGTYPNFTFDVVADIWNHYGWISQDATIVTGYYGARLDNDNNYIANKMYYDDIMVIDLTDSFGAGKEPSVDIMNTVVANNAGWWDSKLTGLTHDATTMDAHVLSGDVYYRNGIRAVGDMVGHGGYTEAVGVYANPTSGILYVWIPYGAYLADSGSGSNTPGITVSAPDLVAANFLATKNILGIQGAIPVLGNEEHWGWRRAEVYTAPMNGRIHLRIPLGAYLTAAPEQQGQLGVFADDPDFTPGNFLATVNVFGMQGSIPLYMANLSDSVPALNATTYGGYGDGVNYGLLQIPANHYIGNANWVRSPQPDLLPANIALGKNIMGTAGAAILGKRYATGVVTSGARASEYRLIQGMEIQWGCRITVSGLSFRPSTIVAHNSQGDPDDTMSVLTSNNTIYIEGSSFPVVVRMTSRNVTSYDHSSSAEAIIRVNVGACVVTDDGFTIPGFTPNVPYTWEAWE